MNYQQIRDEYIKFFVDKGHSQIARSSLFLSEDSTTLFTGSGMQPLMPFLLGEKHPKGSRLVNIQPCFRSQDIDSIGDSRHTCFFEMLGNWSLGDYGKEQQIRWFFEFLTDKVGLDPAKLYVTAFIGDKANNIPRDDETANIWQTLFKEKGIDAKIAEIGSSQDGDKRGMKPDERIFFYDDKQNWWSRNGGIETTPINDPCGPDSEVFYDFGPQQHDDNFGKPHPASDSGRFMEIGNQVFMQYRRKQDGSFELLKNQNIDFGGGLERISAAAINSPDIFKIDSIWPIIQRIEKLSKKKYDFTPGDLGFDTIPDCWVEVMKSMRVIADHLRSVTFLAMDGVAPSNKEQGYVMRRLLRRAIRFGLGIGINQELVQYIMPVIPDIFKENYPELEDKIDDIINLLTKEERVFRQTIQKGLREFDKLSEAGLTGEEIFKLYDTYGFPVELSLEEAQKNNIKIADNWKEVFESEMAQQKLRSQTASKGTFKGGLEGESDIHKRYHTVAHLMAQALRIVLGEDVSQCGANITTERLRFDFKYPEKVMPDKLRQIEDIVNQKIKENLEVTFQEYSVGEARQIGAHGEFDSKYGDRVKVYKIANQDGSIFSLEICGGPHVAQTGDIGSGGQSFKIKKEESSSAGVRRIKAVLV